MPIVGETYEGYYITQDIINIFAETDYLKLYITDLLTLKEIKIKHDEATTYIHIEGPKRMFELYGNITYRIS